MKVGEFFGVRWITSRSRHLWRRNYEASRITLGGRGLPATMKREIRNDRRMEHLVTDWRVVEPWRLPCCTLQRRQCGRICLFWNFYRDRFIENAVMMGAQGISVPFLSVEFSQVFLSPDDVRSTCSCTISNPSATAGTYVLEMQA